MAANATTTVTTTENGEKLPYKVKDITLAAYGRREIEVRLVFVFYAAVFRFLRPPLWTWWCS